MKCVVTTLMTISKNFIAHVMKVMKGDNLML